MPVRRNFPYILLRKMELLFLGMLSVKFSKQVDHAEGKSKKEETVVDTLPIK